MKLDQEMVSKILDSIRFKPSGLTITEISRKTGINRNSIAKYLQILLHSGEVTVQKVGNAKMFSISRRIPFSDLMKYSSEFMIVLDEKGQIIHINNPFIEFLNEPEENLTSKNIEEADINIFRSINIAKSVLEAKRGGECSSEVRFEKDGREYWFFIKIRPIVLPSGGTGTDIVLEDVTLRKQAEIALKQLQRQQADIIDFLPDATFAIDKDGIVIAWNRAMEEMTGVPASEVMGKGDHIYALPFKQKRKPLLIDLVNASDEEISKHYRSFKRMENALLTKGHVTFSDGKRLFLMGKATSLYNESGELIGAIESIRDISDLYRTEKALKSSREKYRTIFENSGTSLFVIEQDGTISLANSEAKRFMGVSDAELMGLRWEEFVHEADLKRLKDYFVKRNKDPTSVPRQYEARILRTDGEIKHGLITVEFIAESKQRLLSLIDISERRERENQIYAQRNLGLYLSSAESLESGLKAALETAISVSGMDSGGIYVSDYEKEAVVLECAIGFSDEFVREQSHGDLKSSQFGIIKSGKSVIINLKDLDSLGIPAIRNEGIRAIAIIPLFYREKVIGCMNIASHTLDEVPETSVNALETIGIMAGNYLANCDYDAKLRKQKENLSELFNAIPFVAILFDSDGHVLEGSQRAVSCINRTCNLQINGTSELIGMYISDICPASCSEARQEFFKRALRSTESLCEREEVEGLILKNTLYPIRDARGNLESVALFSRDITNEVRAREEIEELEQQHKTVCEQSPFGLLLYDPVCGTGDLNPAFKQIFGLKDFRDMKGIDPFELFNIPEGRREKLKNGKNVQHMTTFDFDLARSERRFGTKKTGTAQIDLTISPLLPLSQEKGLNYLFIANDLTEKLETENKLHISEYKFRTVFDNANDAFFILDYLPGGKPGAFIEVNDAACRMLGYAREELIGIHPYEIGGLKDFISPESMEKINQPGKPLIEGYLERKDGTKIPIEANSSVCSVDNQCFVFSFARDITRRLKIEAELSDAEEQLKTMVDALPEAAYIKNSEGRFLVVNSAFEQIVGMDQADIIGKTNSEVLLQDLAAQCDRSDNEVVMKRIHVFAEEVSEDEGGSGIIFKTLKYPILDDSGAVKYIVGISRDITTEKVADLKIQSLQQNLEKLEKERASDLMKVNEIMTFIIREHEYAQKELELERNAMIKVLDLLDPALVMLDAGGGIIITNARCREALGYAANDLTGMNWFMFIPDESVRQEAITLQRDIANGSAMKTNIHAPVTRSDGSIMEGEWNISPLIDKDGEISTILWMMR